MRVGILLLVLASTLSFVLLRDVALVAARDGGTALTGAVSSQAEGKMEGVVVTARADGAKVSVSVVSDGSGRYTFPRSHVAPGRYTVTIKAAGYELGAPAAVSVEAAKTATLDLKLDRAADPTTQLTSREWAQGLPGPDTMREATVESIAVSCTYCHSLERVIKSKYTAEQWVPVITRMQRYYPDGSAAPTRTGRGRAILKEKEGVEAAEKSPWWGPDEKYGVSKVELGRYLATINMSGGRTAPAVTAKALPRPAGKATRVIITTWDLPRKDTVSHDSDVDSKGNLWYTDESAMFLGKLDPRTNQITEYPLPPVNKGDVPGARDIIVDKQDNVWFSMRVPGSHSVLHKFEPATQKLTPIEGVEGQFVALQPDGSHVWLGFLRIDVKTGRVDGDFRHPPNLPPGPQAPIYGFDVNSKGNPYGTDFRNSKIYGVDVTKSEATYWPVGRSGVIPRRGRIDRDDRFWFGEYGGDAIGMFDTRTNTISEFKVPNKFTTPYTASATDAKGYVYSPSNTAEVLLQLNPKTGEVVEFPMPQGPGNFDTKKMAIDPVTRRAVLFANTRNAELIRVEPLD